MSESGAQSPDPAAEGSLAERLRARFGEDVDPDVELSEPEEEGKGAAFASALVARLSGRSGSFGRYALKGEIARGGMGAILRVWDGDLHRHLAMKVVLGQAEARETGATPPIESSKLARFLEEAQVTGQLDHPGVVPVHELGLDPEGRVYFTMKLVKGRSLKEVFDLVARGEEGWTRTKALGVLLKVCEAMAYAHHKGVIHRDLKPANVMVGKFGEVHVMDWGLARILGREDERDIRLRHEAPLLSTQLRSDRDEHRGETPDSPLYTMDGDVVGTPAYMPPEQAAGNVSEVGPHSDVYALGAMLYHLYAGHMPYAPRGSRLTNYAIWGLVQQGPPTRIASVARDMPVELAAICEKAMAREGKDRYRDVSELAADLSAFLEHRVVAAYETGAWAESKKWVERNRALAASLAAGVFALVLGIVVSVVLGEKASRNELAAKANETRALVGESEAKRLEAQAARNLEEVLSLQAIQELEELRGEADRLWPAEPALLGSYDAWLARANLLVEGRPADPSRGIERWFGLADHQAKLAAIRRRAKPLTEEQREADRRSSRSYEELERARAHGLWMARMLGELAWPSEGDVELAIAAESLPSDGRSLDDLAWPLVDPDPRSAVYGGEVRALLLARRAVAAATDGDERSLFRETLAWALYRNGRFDEALAEQGRAVEDAAGEQKAALVAGSPRLVETVASWRGTENRSRIARDKVHLEERLAELEKDVDARRTYEFEDGTDSWWNAHLAELVDGIEAFRDAQTGIAADGVSLEHSWGIRKRRALAPAIDERTASGAEARRRWEEAIAAVAASPAYGGFALEVQPGLLPVGPDPASGLWEFVHLASGEGLDPPGRGADGKLAVTEATGIVLVLIPGGTFRMGAQRTDPAGDHYDPLARDDESPVREVTLLPFLLSRNEMTQAQWRRLTGTNPSLYDSLNYDPTWDASGRLQGDLHPVEQVTWEECMRTLPRFGLTLPTEAQWEYACRAGTSTVYWTGDAVESLRGAANLSDAYGKSHGNEGWKSWEEWLDDGQTVHAQIDSYRPNPFGLVDMHGNVWEWCRDGYGVNDYQRPVREGDGERETPAPGSRVFRGGSFAGVAVYARVSGRYFDGPDRRGSGIGLRPSAALRSR